MNATVWTCFNCLDLRIAKGINKISRSSKKSNSRKKGFFMLKEENERVYPNPRSWSSSPTWPQPFYLRGLRPQWVKAVKYEIDKRNELRYVLCKTLDLGIDHHEMDLKTKHKVDDFMDKIQGKDRRERVPMQHTLLYGVCLCKLHRLINSFYNCLWRQNRRITFLLKYLWK